MLDLLIRGAQVITPDGGTEASVGVADGRIALIERTTAERAALVVDAAGLSLFPGVVDAHVHFNDPGRTAWEGVRTGSAALAAGGGTCFVDMPLNSSPPTLDADSFAAKRAACEASAVTDFALWGGLTPLNLDTLEELADCGVVGFKAFMSSSGIDDFRCCDDLSLYRGMKKAAALGLPVAVHAESESITSALTREARSSGNRGIRDYLDSRPIVAETEAIARAIHFAAETGCSLHVVHVSSPAGVALVRDAASRGVCTVTCETCPHYLILCDSDLEAIGARAKCAPPLRPAGVRDALVADLLADRIDFVASDHSPSPPDMKSADDFFAVWGGIAGVQSTLRALLTLDVPYARIAHLTSEAPAARYRLPGKGAIRVGADADFTLVDCDARSVLRRDELLDRHRLSPYVGRTFRGSVRRTFVRGKTIFRDGAISGEPGGRFLRPTR